MIKFRSTRSGRVVDYPEPNEVLAAAEDEAERLASLGSKKAKREAEGIAEWGIKQAAHHRRTIEKMDDSDVWERYDENEVPSPANPLSEPVEESDAGADEPKTPAAAKKAASKGQTTKG